MNPVDVALRFVKAINKKDTKALYDLMTEDHVLIDSGGEIYKNREELKKGWTAYFKMMPDYKIEIINTLQKENIIVILGKASGTYTSDGEIKRENHWEVFAAWRVMIAGNRVKEWQVYADIESVREIIRREANSNKI